MAGWQRCDRCRRVLPAVEFGEGATSCQACLAMPVTPVKAVSGTRSSTVTRSRTTPRPAAAPAPSGPRPARVGIAGSGDLEVRERRAQRSAQEALAALHPEEFGMLLRDARLAEGLRPTS